MRVARIVGCAQAHGGGVVAGCVGDVAVVYLVGCAVNPSLSRCCILHHHGAHAQGSDVAFGIFRPVLQVEHRDAAVFSGHRRRFAETCLLHAHGVAGGVHAVVVAQGTGTVGEGNAPVYGLRTVLGAGDGFFHIAEKHRPGGEHVDVHQSEHAARLDVGLHLGAPSVAAPLARHRVVGLHHAHHLGHDV